MLWLTKFMSQLLEKQIIGTGTLICELFARLADAKIYKIVMPILGSGHGGLNSPLALADLLLAIAEAANYNQGSQRPKNVTIVIFKKDSNNRADVDLIVARRELALITSKN